MEIATLIIACLAFIAVCVGLFLNHKSNLNLQEQIKNVAESSKQELLTSKSEINKTINERSEQLKTEIKNEIEDSGKTIKRNSDEFKIEFKETFENKSVWTKDEIQNSNTKLYKETTDSIETRIKSFQSEIQTTIEKMKADFDVNSTSINQTVHKTGTEIKTKIEESLKVQEECQSKTLASVDDKFQKVINEIKSPLSID